MARLGEFPLLYEPGARWLYQVAADILGVLITRITGKPLETFLRECLFDPLQMVDTSFVVSSEKRSRLAALYFRILIATTLIDLWENLVAVFAWTGK